MAISNRDRVGRALEVFAAGAVPFADQHMAAASADVPMDWLEMLVRREEQRTGRRVEMSKTDPSLLLRVLTDNRNAFKSALSRTEYTYATELRDVRNRWAHNDPFTSDDTYRALDTTERLLTAMGAVPQADEIRKSKLDHQRLVHEKETQKVVRSNAAQLVEGMGIKPWREVIAPHEDVRENRFHAAEFAADLYNVAHGDADSDEYGDPEEFFRRTYLTEGLRDLLSRAIRRLSGDPNASPVVNLQTNFGGGKTHSMLALYHIFSGRPLIAYPQEVQELLAGTDLERLGRRVQRVVLVGNHLPAHGLDPKPDGTQIKTMWGELAWQLGGRAGYDSIVRADIERTNPGAALTELIMAYSPCVILIDEWVAYARQLYGRDDLDGGSFATQFTFAQTLTEAVKAVPGAMLVVSIPASSDVDGTRHGGSGGVELEVGGVNGQQALAQLQQVVGRLADPWRPASAQESFEIVRRRLFEAPTGNALRDIAAVARQFAQFYHQHKGEFPSGCAEPEYEARIRAAYPVHPELFDRLYTDWSTLEKFQRTRGVLRLLSKVVHALWVSGDAAPLIMPGSVPLDVTDARDEITQYLEDSWKAIIDADVDGTGSSPAAVDSSRSAFGQRALTRRIARTIFLGSAPTLRSAHKGIEQQRIWLGVAVPGDQIGNFGSALHLLGDRATYLYNDGGRWWYDLQESVLRSARDHADRLRDRPEEVWAEIVTRLRRSEPRTPGDFVAIHPAPDSSAEIRDDPEARLVILHPRFPHARGENDSAALAFARQALDTRGPAQRVHRNMLVFLAPDRRRIEELEDATRQYLAWKVIAGSVVERNLTADQAKQAESRRDDADQAVTLRIPETYTWALVPIQPDPARPITWEPVRAEGSEAKLGVRTSAKLRQSDLLRVVHGPSNIRRDLEQKLSRVWSAGHISVGELWALYCRYPYLARLRNRHVLDEGVRAGLEELAWTVTGFALATGYDDATGKYEGLALPHEDSFGQIVDTTLVVDAARARSQRDLEVTERQAEQARQAGQPMTVIAPGVLGTTPPSSPGPTTPAEPARPTRFFGVYQVDPNPVRRMKLLADLDREVLQHLAADEDVELSISIEITAARRAGFSEDKVRTVRENARALKFEQAEFEAE
jgi:predicted AAA+ superfamily ATPase